MKNYIIQINQDALQDIRDTADWYNFKTKGLGDEFKKQAISQINTLKRTLLFTPFVMPMYVVC